MRERVLTQRPFRRAGAGPCAKRGKAGIDRVATCPRRYCTRRRSGRPRYSAAINCSVSSSGTGRRSSISLGTTCQKRPRKRDRKSVVLGKSVSVRVDLGGRRNIKKRQIKYNKYTRCTKTRR